mmetsp:Transcript_11721/g.19941  ORF Transcript_11721/g.19941 Transcript_11721/m.19941 type:complete len:271 (-) Transcript_11721:83-895(-)
MCKVAFGDSLEGVGATGPPISLQSHESKGADAQAPHPLQIVAPDACHTPWSTLVEHGHVHRRSSWRSSPFGTTGGHVAEGLRSLGRGSPGDGRRRPALGVTNGWRSAGRRAHRRGCSAARGWRPFRGQRRGLSRRSETPALVAVSLGQAVGRSRRWHLTSPISIHAGLLLRRWEFGHRRQHVHSAVFRRRALGFGRELLAQDDARRLGPGKVLQTTTRFQVVASSVLALVPDLLILHFDAIRLFQFHLEALNLLILTHHENALLLSQGEH